MSHQHFLDLAGATNLIPGPKSTEMTSTKGLKEPDGKGLIVAGLCFIIPAVIITAFFAWAYQLYSNYHGTAFMELSLLSFLLLLLP